MKNYIDLGPCDLGRRKLMAYLDTGDYYGIGPMYLHGVRLKYKEEMTRPGDKYRLVLIRILKRDEPKFIAAMEDLKAKMLICGHTDYESRGCALMDQMEKEIQGKAG